MVNKGDSMKFLINLDAANIISAIEEAYDDDAEELTIQVEGEVFKDKTSGSDFSVITSVTLIGERQASYIKTIQRKE